MSTPQGPMPGDDGPDSEDPNVAAIPFVSEGIISGVVGAGVIALFFLLVDLAGRQAFWTPYALGSALFTGRMPAADSSVTPALVAGYTLMHLSVFAGLGVLAAFVTVGRPIGLGLGAAIAGGLFVGSEICFLGYSALAAPDVSDVYGFGSVAVANALAAAAMAATLAARRTILRPRLAPAGDDDGHGAGPLR